MSRVSGESSITNTLPENIKYKEQVSDLGLQINELGSIKRKSKYSFTISINSYLENPLKYALFNNKFVMASIFFIL